MNRTFFAAFLLFTGIVILSGAELPDQLEPRLPRKTVIGETPERAMVKDGKVNFEIVVPADAAPSARFAGKEAANLLGKAFGAKIPVRDSVSGNCPAIILGSPEYAAKLGVDISRLDRDGFVIRTCPEGVLIVGRDDPKKDATEILSDHATLFGTYDFLERFAGMRFYLPGDYGTIVPKRAEWVLPAIDIYDRPDFYQRQYSDHFGAPGTEFKGDVRRINKLRHRYHTRLSPYVPHAMRELNYGTRFGKTHPEYFALGSNGKRIIDTEYTGSGHWDESHFCYSSGIKEELIADIVSYFRGEPASVRGVISRTTRKTGWFYCFPPGGKFFTVDLPDGVKKCHCPKCAPELIKGTKEQQRDHYWRFLRDVAQGVKDAHVDGRIVISCHYSYWSGMPPDFDLPDNLLLLFATGGPWSELTPAARDRADAELKAWSEKVGGKLLLWTYPGKYYGEFPGVPASTPRYSDSYLKRVRPYALGCYFESYTDNLFFIYLDFYIWGKILWDPDSDVEALLAEHHRLMFGPAAPLMKEFFDSVERNWMKLAGHTVDTSIGPVNMYPSESEMWSTVYSPAERKRLTDLFDQAEKSTEDQPEYLARIRTLRREMWQPLADSANRFSGQAEALASWGALMPETEQPPVIDGDLSDPVWKQAEPITLIPLRKDLPLTVRTTVRALRDKEYFYFSFDCEGAETPESVVRPSDSRDTWRDSGVEIFLSPDKSLDRCYQIMINASGSVADLLSRGGAEDWSWNSGSEAKSILAPGRGWSVEIRIPRSSMDPASESGMLGNFTRRYFPPAQKPESCVWGPFYTKAHNEIFHFGTLRFQPDERKNLVDGSDFEGVRFSGSKWYWEGAGRAFPAASDYLIAGRYSALLDSARFRTDSCSITQYPDLKPDTEYELSFFVRMEDVKPSEAKSSGFYVRVDDFSKKEKCFPHRNSAAFSGTKSWTPLFFRFRTSPENDGRKPRLCFILRRAAGKVWIDHVRLEEIRSGK